MSDIVKRLRSSVIWYNANAETVMEAAAEIERLRAALEKVACGIGEIPLLLGAPRWRAAHDR